MPFKNELARIENEVNKGIGSKVITHLIATDEKRITKGLSSGSLTLNYALSGYPAVGYAWGRIIEIYGPEMSGKTTLALHAVCETQKLGLPTMYIDAEHSCDPKYMENIGIDLRKLSFVQPDYGEQALKICRKALLSGYKLIVIDSVAALTPLAELEGDIGDSRMGVQARMMGQAMRVLTSTISKEKAIVIFINQIREKIGIMFGSPEVTTGGRALKFYASYRIEVRSPRSGKIEEKDMSETVEKGIKVNAKVVKNKLYPPFRSTTFTIMYGKGIDKLHDAVALLEKIKIFKQTKRNKAALKIGKRLYTAKELYNELSQGDKELKSEVRQILKREFSK